MEAVVGLLRGLQLSPSRMRANLDLTDGLINAEAVMLSLADRLGRQEAHHVVHQAVDEVNSEAISFREALCRDPRLSVV